MFGCESEPARRDSRRKRRTTDSIAPLGAQLLQRDPAVEVGLAREVDDGHAATAELAADRRSDRRRARASRATKTRSGRRARYIERASCTLARREFYNHCGVLRAEDVVPVTPRSSHSCGHA